MAFQRMYSDIEKASDAAALRYWAANAPDMHEPSTYQQEPTTLGQQAIEDKRTESTLKKAAEAPGQPALPKQEKSDMFGLEFKGMAGAPPPPDQPNRGLPMNQSPQTDYKPSRTADWKKWQQNMIKYSGAKTPAEIAAANEQIGLYKQRRFTETWNQAMALHQQGNVEGAAQLYQRAYDYVTNGQGATMRGDPQTGKVLAMPFHEESGVAGKSQAFSVEDAREVLTQMGPAVFGRDPAGAAQTAWGQEQRAQQMHPSAVALQEAKVETERMRPGYLRAQTDYTGAQAESTRSTTGRQEDLHPFAMRTAEAVSNMKGLEYATEDFKFQAIADLRAVMEDVRSDDGTLVEEELRRRGIDPIEATPDQLDAAEDIVFDNAVRNYLLAAAPEKLGEKQMQLELELAKSQAKAIAKQDITMDYLEDLDAAADKAFSETRIEAGKGSPDLLEQAFWGQTGAGLDTIKDSMKMIVNENVQKGLYPLSATAAQRAVKTFYTNPDNVRTVNQGNLFSAPSGELFRAGESFVIVPETNEYIRIPTRLVEPLRQMAARHTAEAQQKLANQAQTEASRALPQDQALPTGTEATAEGF